MARWEPHGDRRSGRRWVGELLRWSLTLLCGLGVLFGLLGILVGVVERDGGIAIFYSVWVAIFGGLLAAVLLWIRNAAERGRSRPAQPIVRMPGPATQPPTMLPPRYWSPTTAPTSGPLAPPPAPPHRPPMLDADKTTYRHHATHRNRTPIPSDAAADSRTASKRRVPAAQPETLGVAAQMPRVDLSKPRVSLRKASDGQPRVRPTSGLAPEPAIRSQDVDPAQAVQSRVRQSTDDRSEARSLVQANSVHEWDPKGIPFVAAPTSDLGTREDLDRIGDRQVRSVIRDAVLETIAIEGPIEYQLLMGKVVRRFGWQRASEKRQVPVFGAIPNELIRTTPLGVFVWPADLDPNTWRGFRLTTGAEKRRLDTICPEEIINAMCHVARGRVCGRAALMRETLGLFNQRRLTENSAFRLERCIDMAVRAGRLEQSGSGYRAVDR